MITLKGWNTWVIMELRLPNRETSIREKEDMVGIGNRGQVKKFLTWSRLQVLQSYPRTLERRNMEVRSNYVK
jgi:hypothetical protein